MELFIEIVLIAALVGGFFGIGALINNQKYQANNKAYKNMIAFILGFVSMVFCPGLLYSFYRVSLFFSYGYITSTIAQIALFLVNIIGPCICVYAGMAVYYHLCNKSNWGQKLGYVLFGIASILCVLSTYSQFYYEGNFISGTCWIIAVAIGLVSTIKYSKELLIIDIDDRQKDTDLDFLTDYESFYNEQEQENSHTDTNNSNYAFEETHCETEKNDCVHDNTEQNKLNKLETLPLLETREKNIIKKFAELNNLSETEYLLELEKSLQKQGYAYDETKDETKLHSIFQFYAKESGLSYDEYLDYVEKNN